MPHALCSGVVKGDQNRLAVSGMGLPDRDNTGTDNEPGNQLAGFDFKFKLEPTLGWPVSFYGQMIGEDEAGGLPSANMYTGGIEGHHGWGKKMRLTGMWKAMIPVPI